MAPLRIIQLLDRHEGQGQILGEMWILSALHRTG